MFYDGQNDCVSIYLILFLADYHVNNMVFHLEIWESQNISSMLDLYLNYILHLDILFTDLDLVVALLVLMKSKAFPMYLIILI